MPCTDVCLVKKRSLNKLTAENLQDTIKSHKYNSDLLPFHIFKVHYGSIMKYWYWPSVSWYSIISKNSMIYWWYCPSSNFKALGLLVLLFVALWFILRGILLYVFPCVILFLCFSVLLILRLPRLGKRELILVLFVRLFGLCLFRFVGFLFLLGSGKGCSLWLWHSLNFSLTFILFWRNKVDTYNNRMSWISKMIPHWSVLDLEADTYQSRMPWSQSWYLWY